MTSLLAATSVNLFTPHPTNNPTNQTVRMMLSKAVPPTSLRGHNRDWFSPSTVLFLSCYLVFGVLALLDDLTLTVAPLYRGREGVSSVRPSMTPDRWRVYRPLTNLGTPRILRGELLIQCHGYMTK